MISDRLLTKASNRCVVTPAWATLGDWLDILAANPVATPLIDFGDNAPLMRVGGTALNWYLMDLLGLRGEWYASGWQARDEVWLLINPLRYRILGHQPRRPYAYDVRDYLERLAPQLLREPLYQHAYLATIPVVDRHETDDREAEALASQAPWGRIAVRDPQTDQIIGMVWSPGPTANILPPILKHPRSAGSVTYTYKS
jgi:hypothetical protein